MSVPCPLCLFVCLRVYPYVSCLPASVRLLPLYPWMTIRPFLAVCLGLFVCGFSCTRYDCLPVCLSVFLSVCLSVCLSACQSVCSSVHLFGSICLCLSVCIRLDVSVYLLPICACPCLAPPCLPGSVLSVFVVDWLVGCPTR